MVRRTVMMAGGMLLTLPALALDNKTARFWNPASATIFGFHLSSPNAGSWAENLNENGAVDHDERRKLPPVVTGKLDARLVDATDRRCFVPDVAVLADEAS